MNTAFEAGPGLAAGPDELAEARLLAMLRTALTTTEAAARLGLTETTVRRQLRSGRLFGIQRHRRWLLPAFQFSLYEQGLVPGMASCLAALPNGMDPVAVYQWFHTAHPTLDMDGAGDIASPIDWLRACFPEDAVATLAATA